MRTNPRRTSLATAFLLAAAAGTCSASVRYVDAASTNSTPPFTDWTNAAATIQAAVDAADVGDEVIVTNGVYATGGRAVYGTMTNRVAVDKVLTLRSVNGPEVTFIQGSKTPVGTGSAAIRCVYLTNGAALWGFTLTNGATHASGDTSRECSGGGIWCASVTAVVSNCLVISNIASYFAGGVYSGTLNACTISNNVASWCGGGSCYGALYNCTLNSNSALYDGGGAFSNLLVNCTLKRNSTRQGRGGGAYLGTLENCLLLTNSASDYSGKNGGGACSNVLNGCTLIGNWATGDGGGVYGGRVSNCLFVANSATYGGAASWSTLANCTLTNNAATNWGGGVVSSTLKGCVLVGNNAPSAGGADDSRLVNCTVAANRFEGCANSYLTNCIAYFNNGWDWYGSVVYCCIGWPLPSGGGNITNAPLFVDAAHGDLRLQSNSPCINAGRNAYAPTSLDLDGNPRIVSGTVDMGAYEYQGSGSQISYAWLQQYGLPTDGSADSLDSDADGRNNYQEWRCLTDPTNALSVLHLLPPTFDGTNVLLSWEAVAGVSYFLDYTTNLAAAPVFSPLATNLASSQSYTRTYATPIAAPTRFYRLGVGP